MMETHGVREGKRWPTQNLELMVTLVAAGHKPVAKSYRDGVVWYHFSLDEICDLVDRFAGDEKIMIEAHDFWRAWDEVKQDLRSMKKRSGE